MRHVNRYVVWLTLIISMLFVLGCPKEPARVNMVLAASPQVNTDAGGQPLSVVVRVYQLKDKGRLEAADYNAIWKADRETLSDDFLDRQERIVQPGTQEMLEVRANPMAAYLGVVALFRNPSGDSWRSIVPLKGKAQKITLNLREQSIELSSIAK